MKKYLNFILQPPVTRTFFTKLSHNFHTLTPGEMVLYFIFIRPFWDKKRRFFFEGSLGLLGQMYTAERKALYEIITSYRPRQCYEIGTFTGGGSTYFISKAMADNNFGTLITMENDTHYFTKSKNYFSKNLTDQNSHLLFLHDSTPQAFTAHIPTDQKVDCVFFDGAEDAEQTLEQYNYFKPYLKTGSIIMFHDWNTEKSAAVKPCIVTDQAWEQLMVLEPPVSVGFAAFKHT